MIDLPADVRARLGPTPEELVGLGPSRLLRGDGLVAKFGWEERAAREAFILGDASALVPVDTPTLVDAGPGWILMEVAEGDPAVSDDVRGLERLAPMHELFVGATGIEDPRFRDVFGRERDGLLDAARAVAPALPEPLASLLADPSSLFAIVDAEPRTLVHGDCWYGNVLAHGPAQLTWLDWEDAGAGPAALDLARWIHGSARFPASANPEGNLAAYVASRTDAVDPRPLRVAVDAAAALAFLLLDLAEAEAPLIDRRNELARELVG